MKTVKGWCAVPARLFSLPHFARCALACATVLTLSATGSQARSIPLTDMPAAGLIEFTGVAFAAGEADGSALITLRRLAGSAGEAAVNVSVVGGTAALGADFTLAAEVVTFADGVTEQSLTVTLVNDPDYEGDETVQFALSAPTGGATLGLNATTTLTMRDDESGFQFSQPVYRVNEVLGGAQITVTRGGSSAALATVDFAATAGSAVAGTDFTATNGTLTFAAGVATRSFTVPLIDNTTREVASRTAQLTLSNPTGGAVLGTPAAATLEILDNDFVGGVDAGYRLPSGGGRPVNALALMDDGRLIVGGRLNFYLQDFIQLEFYGAEFVARLEQDGALDRSFQPRLAWDFLLSSNLCEIRSLSLCADESVLSAVGSLDPTSSPPIGLVRLKPTSVSDLYYRSGKLALLSARATLALPEGDALVGGASFPSDLLPWQRSIIRVRESGEFDSRFDPAARTDGDVFAMVRLPNGRFLVAGAFTNVADQLRPGLARLNGDLSVDPTFDAGSGAEGTVLALAVEPDGKILLGGDFTRFNGRSCGRLIRLQSDGAVDETWDASGCGDGEVRALALQLDGRIVLGGTFTLAGGQSRGGVARLEEDGTLDASLDPGLGADGPVNAVAVQLDGQILIGGGFRQVSGATRPGLARLNGDGFTGTTYLFFDRSVFTASERDGTAAVMVRRGGDSTQTTAVHFGTTDGSATAGVDYTATSIDVVFAPGETTKTVTIPLTGDVLAEGVETVALVLSAVNPADQVTRAAATLRILDDETPGALVTAFAVRPPAPFGVRALATLPDGRMLIGGGGGTNLGGVLRLNPDLTWDERFQTNANKTGLFSSTHTPIKRTVMAMAPLADGKTLLAATLDRTNWINSPNSATNFILRLNPDGSTDTRFNASLYFRIATSPQIDFGLWALAVQPDGRMVAGGYGSFALPSSPSQTFALARLHPDGSHDPSFTPPRYGLLHPNIRALAFQPDGKLLVGGLFSIMGDCLQRLNSDGSVDNSFGTSLLGTVWCIALRPDGRIVAGGAFTNRFGTSLTKGLTRLLSDGTPDPDFHTEVNGPVLALALRPDGRLLIGGDFSRVDGVLRRRLALLKSDGSLDASYDPGLGANDSVRAFAFALDDQPLMGGAFTSYDGFERAGLARLHEANNPGVVQFTEGHVEVSETGGSAEVKVLRTGGSQGTVSVRVETADGSATSGADYLPVSTEIEFTDGEYGTKSIAVPVLTDDVFENDETATLILGQPSGGATKGTLDRSVMLIHDALIRTGDTNFSFSAFDMVYSVVPVADGKAVIGGMFTSIQSVPRNRIARLNANGSLDESFNPGTGANRDVLNLLAYPDGRVLVAGYFSRFNGVGRTNLARLNPDGALDENFDARNAVTRLEGSPGLALQPDGRLLVGGPLLKRLNPDGSVDASFQSTLTLVRAILCLPDGRILVGGSFRTSRPGMFDLARLESDGTEDLTFNATATLRPAETAPQAFVSSLARQPDGRILVGGSFLFVNGIWRNMVARLEPDGSVDASFVGGATSTGTIESLALMPDGSVFIGGTFTKLDGVPRNLIAHLASDGAVDWGFAPTISGFGVMSMAAAPAGGLWIGGLFNLNLGSVVNRGVAHFLGVANQPPAVTVDSPAPGAVFTAGDVIPLRATASDPDGWIDRVEFWSGATLLGAAESEPYSLTLPNAAAGDYTLTAAALDGFGLPTVSAPVAFSVVGAVRPQFTGDPVFTASELRLSLSGVAGHRYELQGSIDLVTWVPIMSDVATAAGVVLVDPEINEHSARFYRVVEINP